MNGSGPSTTEYFSGCWSLHPRSLPNQFGFHEPGDYSIAYKFFIALWSQTNYSTSLSLNGICHQPFNHFSSHQMALLKVWQPIHRAQCRSLLGCGGGLCGVENRQFSPSKKSPEVQDTQVSQESSRPSICPSPAPNPGQLLL